MGVVVTYQHYARRRGLTDNDKTREFDHTDSVRAVVRSVVRRREQGEVVHDSDVLDANPQLRPKLDEELNKLQPLERSHAQLDTSGQGIQAPEPLGRKSKTRRPPPDPPQIPGFSISKLLGCGGMGAVFLADDEHRHRQVAIKIPLAGELPLAEAGKLLLEEAAYARNLPPHACIVTVYESGTTSTGVSYVSMEFISGPSLKDVLMRGPIAPMKAARLVARIAEAVQHCHLRDLFHRDLKPGNIMLTEDGCPKLTDFGLSIEAHKQREHRGRVCGTPQFMSPEQVRGEVHLLDGRCDVWSLGVILYLMLVGRLPFDGEDTRELFEQILKRDPRPPSQMRSRIPKGLENIVLKSLRRKPEDRYRSAGDLAADLHAFLARESRRRLLILAAMSTTVILTGLAWARPWKSTSRGITFSPPAPSPSLPARVERAELHVQRGPAAESVDSRIWVADGHEQFAARLPPLGSGDRFVVFFRLSQPLAWTLIHVDPAGGAAVVARDDVPTMDIRIPATTGRGVSFRADDPKGENLLLLLGGVPVESLNSEQLASQIASARDGLQTLADHRTRLRAGTQEHDTVIQLPQDAIRDIRQSLPAGLIPLHAMYLTTKE